MKQTYWIFFSRLMKSIGITVITLIVMCLLPQRDAIRWEAVRTEAYARFGWIYHRIHDDPTPVDIAFIGTSHTMMGIDTPVFQSVIRDQGLRNPDGSCSNVVNMAMPSYGRDLHWMIASELLTTRPVKMIVLEVFENETRKAHPLFAHVAQAKDIVSAPILVNLGYFHNLIRLPFRQLSLAVKSIWPSVFGLKVTFDPNDYDGSDVDNSQVINVDGAAISPLRNHVIDKDELEATAQWARDNKNLHMLPVWAQKYEYAVPDHYVTALMDLAEAKGTKIMFVYLPQYGMPDKPFDDQLYRDRGSWLYANDLLRRQDFWFDPAHLNSVGALAVTKELATNFVSQEKTMPDDGFTFPASPAGCKPAAFPPRASLKPYVPGHTPIDSDD